MRPAPTNKKDTLMLRKNSNTNTINQTSNYALVDYFQVMRMYTDTYLLGIPNNVHIYWYVFIRNRTDGD